MLCSDICVHVEVQYRGGSGLYSRLLKVMSRIFPCTIKVHEELCFYKWVLVQH